MPKRDPMKYMSTFADVLIEHHAADLNSNTKRRNAVIVKMVALQVLAFGIPATTGGSVDIDEAITNLRHALGILEVRIHA